MKTQPISSDGSTFHSEYSNRRSFAGPSEDVARHQHDIQPRLGPQA